MRQQCLRAIVFASAVLTAAATAVVGAPVPSAAAEPGLVVSPGMEIRQDLNVCTLGFVDLQTRTGYAAGHCRGSGVVNDRNGVFVGSQTMFRDNTPDGATVATDYQISDWQTIALAPEVVINDVLPGGRPLVADPAVVPTQGQRVCHFGIVTGESCGTIESVNNGWFTMTNGVVSKKGDSGGPVYVPTDDGRAVIIGMFNSTWGSLPAAVSWQSINQQIREEVVTSSAGTVGGPIAPPAPAVPPPA
ncbi:hypothetical protein ACFQWH_24590 [Mycolicibacterium sp. GCM10028919]|uniref:Rv1815 family serine proteinase n=1 Tax=Mycolicibacterium sp. GCM10028919 TaxID=3273401 RepID=UPI0036071707